MRFDGAARLLALLESVKPEAKQVDPGDRPFIALSPQSKVPKDLLQGSHSQLRGSHVVPVDPRKEKARRSLLDRLFKEKPSWEGVLRNVKKTNQKHSNEDPTSGKLCNPSSVDADVGLLSCGVNYYCVESRDSYLGGVCVEVEVDGDNEFGFVASESESEGYRSVVEPTWRELDVTCTNCTGYQACFRGPDMVGTCSCNGYFSCFAALGPISNSSCNGYYACRSAADSISTNSCNGDYACNYAVEPISSNSCKGNFACRSAAGPISTNSCNGKKACYYAVDPISTNSCNGDYACLREQDAIGNNSCNGQNACDMCSSGLCYGYTGVPVGNNSCNGDRACDCDNPKGHTTIFQIGDGECNRMGTNFTGDKTCCNGKEFPCECTETDNGLVVGNNTCKSINQGFADGTLKCNNSTCQFDISECIEAVPSPAPSGMPSQDPSPAPTEMPSQDPSPAPTEMPSQDPTEMPSQDPSPAPTEMPSQDPSPAPTKIPSPAPTNMPSQDPSPAPTKMPSQNPSPAPTKCRRHPLQKKCRRKPRRRRL